MIPKDLFPRLTPSNHRVTSAANPAYNCVAWAAGDTEHWWQPGVFWPGEVGEDDQGPRALEQAFLSLGYEDCALDPALEAGFEKVALYGAGLFYTHAARQLPSGKWTSKLGGAEDIEHDTPADVAGGVYGEVVQIMRRILPSPDRTP
ncbi:MAG TPA: hypothetical protein VJ739_11310 [Gemmataceae bacterium]|nr:hypothetical protein [Gemmataceae bacterium]